MDQMGGCSCCFQSLQEKLQQQAGPRLCRYKQLTCRLSSQPEAETEAASGDRGHVTFTYKTKLTTTLGRSEEGHLPAQELYDGVC